MAPRSIFHSCLLQGLAVTNPPAMVASPGAGAVCAGHHTALLVFHKELLSPLSADLPVCISSLLPELRADVL